MTNTKPGWKTTEFWLSNIAFLCGVILASGFLPEGGMAAQIVGGALAILARLGYDAGRAHVKATTAKAQAITTLSMRTEQTALPPSAPGSTSSSNGGAVAEPISDSTSTFAVGTGPHR